MANDDLPSDETGADDAADEAVAAPVEVTGADADHVDELPEDLDAHNFVGPYLFPNNNRRRIPAALYGVMGLLAVLAWFVTKGNDPVLVNNGLLVGAIGLLALAAFSFQAGFDLDVDERDALVAASRAVGFPIGHASAQMGWRGLRSRPTWRILVYSNEEPPEQRGLVLVDGVDGQVVQQFVEENPEDWSDVLAKAGAGKSRTVDKADETPESE